MAYLDYFKDFCTGIIQRVKAIHDYDCDAPKDC